MEKKTAYAVRQCG